MHDNSLRAVGLGHPPYDFDWKTRDAYPGTAVGPEGFSKRTLA